MLLRKKSLILARVISFLWGLNFVLLFRYSLDTLYPFWANKISISLFALTLVLIIYFSFWWYFHHHRKKRKKSFFYATIVLVNTSSFLTFILIAGESGYQYIYPLIFSIQLFLQFFLFAAKLPFFIPYRLSLIAGILPGILPIPYFESPILIFLLSAFLSVFPNRALAETELHFEKNQTRMLPLRQTLDFLRFLFLGLSLFGIFDINRKHFYVVVLLLVVGSMIQILMLRLDRSKHHIRMGVRALAAIFAILGFAYLFSGTYPEINFNYICATGYVLLAIWEALYFKKIVEGYLKREQRIIFIVIVLCIFFYFIDMQWVILLAGLLVVMAQIRLLIYVFNRYRWVIGTLFIVSLTSWVLALSYLFQESYSRRFFNITPVHKVSDTAFPVQWLLQLPANHHLVTNVFSKAVLSSTSVNQTYFKSIQYFDTWPLLLTSSHSYQEEMTIYLFDLQKLYPYNKTIAFSKLQEFFTHNKNVFFYNITHRQKVLLNNKGLPIPLNIEKPTSSEQKLIQFLAERLSKEFTHNKKFFQAYKSFISVLPQLDEQARLYLKAASLAGATNDTAKQIEYLSKYIKLDKRDNIKERNLLLELYYGQGDLERASKVAEDLIKDDNNKTLHYLKWIYRLNVESSKRLNWYRFQSLVKRWRVKKGSIDEKNKNSILQQIKKYMRENPRSHILQQETNERQEFIQFPD